MLVDVVTWTLNRLFVLEIPLMWWKKPPFHKELTENLLKTCWQLL